MEGVRKNRSESNCPEKFNANLGRSKKEKRFLLMSTAMFVFSNGAPIWWNVINILYRRSEMEKIECNAMLSCVGACRNVLKKEFCVLARILRVKLIVEEFILVYKSVKKTHTCTSRQKIRCFML